MDPGYLDKVNEGGNRLRFADYTNDGAVVKNQVFQKCTFEGVGLRESKFIGCSFIASRFIDVHLYKGYFERCDLTAVKFVDTNLRRAKFNDCKLWYTKFNRCEIDYNNIIEHLPEEANMRTALLHNLRMNAIGMGEFRDADRLLLLEMDADASEQWKIAWLIGEHYEKTYCCNPSARLSAICRWAAHIVSKYGWGYGARVLPLVRSAFVIILLFTFLYTISGGPFTDDSTGRALRITSASDWLFAAYTSLSTFTTLGVVGTEHSNWFTKFLISIEAVIGALYIGLTAAVAYRRLCR